MIFDQGYMKSYFIYIMWVSYDFLCDCNFLLVSWENFEKSKSVFFTFFFFLFPNFMPLYYLSTWYFPFHNDN